MVVLAEARLLRLGGRLDPHAPGVAADARERRVRAPVRHRGEIDIADLLDRSPACRERTRLDRLDLVLAEPGARIARRTRRRRARRRVLDAATAFTAPPGATTTSPLRSASWYQRRSDSVVHPTEVATSSAAI